MPKPTLLQRIANRPSRSYIPGAYVEPTDDPRNQPNPYAPAPLPDGTGRHRRGRDPLASYYTDEVESYSAPSSRHESPGPGVAGGARSPLYSPMSESSSLGYARSDLGLGLPPGTGPYASGRSAPRHSPGGPAVLMDEAHPARPWHKPAPLLPNHVHQAQQQAQMTTAQRHAYEYKYSSNVSPPLSYVSSATPAAAPAPMPKRPVLRHSVPLATFKPQPPKPGPTPPTSDLGSRDESRPRARAGEQPRRGSLSSASDSSLDNRTPVRAAPRPAPAAAATPVTPDDDVSDSGVDEFHTPRSSLDSAEEEREGIRAATTEASPDAAIPVPAAVQHTVPTFRLQPPTPLKAPAASPLDESLSRSATRRSTSIADQSSGALGQHGHDRGDGEDDLAYGQQTSLATSASTGPTSDVRPRPPLPRPRQPSPTPRTAPTYASNGDDVPPPLPPKSPRYERGIRNADVTILNRHDSRSTTPPAPLRRSKSSKSVKDRSRRSNHLLEQDRIPTRPASTTGFRSVSDVGVSSAKHAHSQPQRLGGSAMSEVTYARSDSGVGGGHGGVRAAGYGKGGWAAASAAPVVMYMPKDGNDGWAAFQPLPPRSRYTVLPGGTRVLVPHDFALGRHFSGGSVSTGSSSLAPSASASQDGRYRHSSPVVSPTTGPFSLRKHDYSRSSSPLATSPVPASSYRLQAPGSPRTDSPSPLDSDDEWTGEQPSRSYLRKPAPSHPDPASDHTRSSNPSNGTSSLAAEQVSRRYSALPPPPPPTAAEDSSVTLPSSYAPAVSSSSRPSSTLYGNEPRHPPRVSPVAMLDSSLRSAGTASSHHNLDGPSSLDPNILTLLPEMTAEASNRLYSESQSSTSHRRWGTGSGSGLENVKRSKSLRSLKRLSISEAPRDRAASIEDDRKTLASVLTNRTSRISLDGPNRTSRISLDGPNQHAAGTIGPADIVSSAAEHPRSNGYTNLVLPEADAYAFAPAKPLKKSLSQRVRGLPSSAMAAIVLSSSLVAQGRRGEAPTPRHLRFELPPPVDLTHIAPPSKTGDGQFMVQVYAVGVDAFDRHALEDKGLAEVGKWVPGRSFVGRCLIAGDDEKDIQRGELVMGLLDVRRSGALQEYLVVDRRRIARVPNGDLSLEQLALLPSQGVCALRALRGVLARGAHALVMDAHEGVAALICQAMARQGVSVTAVIPRAVRPGGSDVDAGGVVLAEDLDADDMVRACSAHGARHVLRGAPAEVLLAFDEHVFHVVVDTRGGTKVLEAAKRALADGGHLLRLGRADGADPAPAGGAGGNSSAKHKHTGSLRGLMGRGLGVKRGRVAVDEVAVAGTGEPEVDRHGLDVRDVMEETALDHLRPVVSCVVPFERAGEALAQPTGAVVRIIN